ncbi:MAG: hypothetical protein ACPGJU_00730 [Coraliomargarita sp.]
MNLDTATNRIAKSFDKMNEAYRRPVFDELLVVSRAGAEVELLHYSGPRKDTIMESLADETAALRQSGGHLNPNPGEFDFTREGVGSDFDAYICLGKDLFLLCNNTEKSMEEVTADPNWLAAQGQFLNASQFFAMDPLEL